MCKKYRIGITFNLETDKADIWANGANQNVIFLYQLFRQAEIVESVVLVSWGPEKRKEPPEGFMLDDLALNFAYVDEVLDELDVLIEGTLVIDHQYATRMHEHGGKIVAYKMGNDYIMDMEYFLFDRPAGRLPNGVKFDAVWVTPQHQNTGMAYYSTIYHAPAYVVPFIWGTIFCDKVIARIKKEHNLDFGYQLLTMAQQNGLLLLSQTSMYSKLALPLSSSVSMLIAQTQIKLSITMFAIRMKNVIIPHYITLLAIQI